MIRYIQKIILLCFLTLPPNYIYPQIIDPVDIRVDEKGLKFRIINTEEAVSLSNEGSITVNYPQGMDESSPGKPILPQRNFIIAIPPFSNIKAEITSKEQKIYHNTGIKINPDIVLNSDSSLSYRERGVNMKYFEGDSYPLQDIEIVDYIWIRDFYCAVVRINPFQFNWKNKSLTVLVLGELSISFTNIRPFIKSTAPLSEFEDDLKNIILNFDQAIEFRHKRKIIDEKISSANWIDYSKTHYKLGVIRDGIYRITYNDLISYGINPLSINPLTLKLFVKGKQLPLRVFGEGDQSFDEEDYIEFWGTKNYSGENYRSIVNSGMNYLNYMNRYTDTTSLWLVWGGDNGVRINEYTGTPGGSADTISSHIVKLHFEDEQRIWYYDAELPRTQLPFWQEHKVWTWLTSGSNQVQQINFSVSDFLTSTPVKTTVRLISNAGDIVSATHKHGASINSTVPEDSITFNYRQTINFNSNFVSSQLNQGDNVFRVFGLPTAASFHRSLIDWVEIDYFRQNKAVNDSLLIYIPDSLNSAVRNIRITDLQSADTSLLVYKVGAEPKRITGYSYNAGILLFSDTVKGGDRYYILKTSSVLKPDYKYQKQFVNLPDPARGADYIIITNKLLASSVQQYNQFINSNYDVRSAVVYIDDIYDEFSFGENNAESIKEFLITANQNWVSPAPSFLVLAGDANYDYKEKWNPAPSPRKKNLVPSFGFPVSDVWYTMWDSMNTEIPQMYVSRISANDDSELLNFLTKHQNYLSRRFDDYNKRYTFYSGGDPSNISELAQIKAANDSLLNNLIRPVPIGGKGIHFYKSTNPPTNFGIFSPTQIRNAVDSSGLFISYIGHSGTRTWDNGITEVEDIINAFPDRHPLISDFGCSTGKFAEPDVDAFGELFVFQSPNGQAISYLGNSSLGYFSTSLRYPGMFYKLILIDTLTNISKSHFQGKINQLSLFGFNEVNRVFNYCNLLFTDPLLEFAVPRKPNFVVNAGSVVMDNAQLNDLNDSILVSLNIKNWGRVAQDSLEIVVENSYDDSTIYSDIFKIGSPINETTIEFYVITNGLLGQHTLKINLDPNNHINEIYEDDNQVALSYTIYSTSLRALESETFYATKRDTIYLLNPTYETQLGASNLVFSIADNITFENSIEYLNDLTDLFTKVPLNNLQMNQRYWYRTRLNSDQIEWSSSYSFYNVGNNYSWFIDKSHRNADLVFKNVEFDSSTNSWKINQTINHLKVTSAGSNDGKFASMLFNTEERLPNTFFWGMATAEIDSITLEPTRIKYFAAPNSITQSADSLINYISSLPEGKILALAISDDAAQTVLGFSGGTPVRQSIETLGSLYIDSVRYRESWAMLGVKGAAPGTVPESYKKLFEGSAIIDTSILVVNEAGHIVFPAISKSTNWQNVFKSDLIPPGASVEYIPLGIQRNKIVDTLSTLIFIDDSASISFIDAEMYSEIKLLARLYANDLKVSPSIFSLGTNYTSAAELATNYQVVVIDRDSLNQGESIEITFDVYNVGNSTADSVRVLLNVIKPDNGLIRLMDSLIVAILPDQKISFQKKYTTNSTDGYGNMSFRIEIDPNNKIIELYKDNSIFEKKFYVIRDTLTAVNESAVSVTFDGKEIYDGDYVSSAPEIVVSLHYPFWFPIEDTTSLKIFIDNEKIAYAGLDTEFDTLNRIARYSLRPSIVTGESRLRIFAKDIRGVTGTMPLFEKYFTVSDQLKILNAYNYPNPFSESTYFTFTLPTVPDEMKIFIYTIAGRKIREMIFDSRQLRTGYNALYWDGKDQDNDVIANGVYFAKMVIKSADKNFHITQKLSVIR